MRRFLRSLSPHAEFWLVLLLSFGFFIAGSVHAFLSHRERILTNGWALGLVTFELVVLAVISFVGRARGWSLVDLGLRPSLALTGLGILLYFVASFGMNLVYATAAVAAGEAIPRAPITARSLSWVCVVLVSVVNPVFEEALVTGYIVNATARHGAAFAISTSALIRFLYHTYQGPIAAVCILPLGLLFAGIYWRSRELWPLIVAHGLMDLVSLSYMRGVLNST